MSESGPAILRLRVTPNAARNEVAGWHGDALRVRVTMPPAGGRANSAVIHTLADRLGVRPRDIEIVRGRASRDKVARVHGIDSIELIGQLGEPAAVPHPAP